MTWLHSVLAVHKVRLYGCVRDGEMGVWRLGWGGGGGGGREIIYLSLQCHHQNDLCMKVGSDESHFNVS